MSCAQIQQLAMDHKAAVNIAAGALAVAAFIFCWRARRQQVRAAALASAGGFILALSMSLDDFLHAWDERYHALVGLHLALHPLRPTIYQDWPIPLPEFWTHEGIFIHKPPFPLWLIAISLRLLGRCELAVRLPSVILFSVAVFATARIGTLLFEDDGIAAAGAILVALNGALLDLASGRKPTDHADSVFTSLVCVAIWLALLHARREGRALALACGAATGLALLSKWAPAMLVFPVWVAALRGRRSCDVFVAFVLCLAIALPWEAYVRAAFPDAARLESMHRLQHLILPLDHHDGTIFFHLARIPRFFGELSPLALLWFARRRRGTLAFWPVALWIALPYGFFSLVQTRMEMYVMPAAPALALVVAAAALAALRSLEAFAGWRRFGLAAVALALLALPVRYLFERWKPLRTFESERVLARRLRSRPFDGKVLLVLEDHPVESMFYADVIAIPELPPAEALRAAEARGYRVVRARP